MPFYDFLIGTLVVWRLTHLLEAEDGPWDIVVKLRRGAGSGFLGQLLDCFYCLSLWTAAPISVYLRHTWDERILLWPALSAGAIMLQLLTDRAQRDRNTVVIEDQKENDRVMLRQEASAGER